METSKKTSESTMMLFLSGDAPNSRTAKQNLESFCSKYPDIHFSITEIDVLQDTQTAVDHNIYITPALKVITPEPGLLLFGNLHSQISLDSLFKKM